MYNTIIVGCGFAGAVLGRELAKKGEKVCILEQRSHVGGNAYDEKEEHGILIHKYGPHIFHTNSKEVYDYLSQFTDWYSYSHEVVGNIYGKEIPVPFNLNTLFLVFGEEKGERLKKKLIDTYGENSRVPILKLRENQDTELKEIADYVYENIFLKYTMKQWGQTPEEIDPSVSGRVPVLVSYDNRYFQDKYQGMPLNGYTGLFEKMLEADGLEVRLNTSADEVIDIKDGRIYFEGKQFEGKLVFTGALDEFFHCCYGRLPYRSLRFATEHYPQKHWQSHAVVNYTVTEDYTRITEYTYLTGQDTPDTVIMKEYPQPYTGAEGEIPYYAILNDTNRELYERYADKVRQIPGFYLLGRLAEYKYYNMDAIVERALALAKELA